jgi:hypothetical protein
MAPSMFSISLPVGVAVSRFRARTRRAPPLASSLSTMAQRLATKRASLSSFVTTSVSPCRAWSLACWKRIVVPVGERIGKQHKLTYRAPRQKSWRREQSSAPHWTWIIWVWIIGAPAIAFIALSGQGFRKSDESKTTPPPASQPSPAIGRASTESKIGSEGSADSHHPDAPQSRVGRSV